jgi:hypothetical protein
MRENYSGCQSDRLMHLNLELTLARIQKIAAADGIGRRRQTIRHCQRAAMPMLDKKRSGAFARAATLLT